MIPLLETRGSGRRPKVCRTLVELEKIVAEGLDVLIADGSLAQRHFVGWIADSCADVVMAITSMEPEPLFQAPVRPA